MSQREKTELRVLAVITDENGRTVLLRPRGGNSSSLGWQMPGGLVGFPESTREALGAFLASQMGLKNAKIDPTPCHLTEVVKTSDETKVVTAYFRVRVTEPIPETHNVFWIKPMDKDEMANRTIAEDALAFLFGQRPEYK